MIITVSSDALSNRLALLSKALGPGNKNSSSILNCFLFEVRGNDLIITASDSENTMTSTMPLIDSSDDGLFAINAQFIINAIRDMADQPLTLDVDPDVRTVLLTSASGDYNFISDDATAYPRPADIGEDVTTVTLPSNILAQNLERTIFATGDDQYRHVMNGVYFDFLQDMLCVVATDGRILVRNQIKNIQTAEPTSFILPKKPAMLLKNALNDDETEVTVKFNGGQALFVFDGGVLHCRLIEGRYPNYNSVVQHNNPYLVAVDRQLLLTALKRVMPFASDSSQLVRLDVEDSRITICSEDIEFAKKGVEKLPCAYTGNKISIGFKGSSFISLLSNMPFPEMTIQIGDPSRPALMLPSEQPENQNILTLIMPMLLND